MRVIHIMCGRTEMFFVSSDMIQVFLVCLDKVAEKYAFRAIYCFMPDHLPLIALGNSDNTDLLRAVEEFKQRTGVLAS